LACPWAISTLHFGFAYPVGRAPSRRRLRYGAAPDQRKQSPRAEAAAVRYRDIGHGESRRNLRTRTTRFQFQNKDPRAGGEFADQLAEHSGKAAPDDARRTKP